MQNKTKAKNITLLCSKTTSFFICCIIHIRQKCHLNVFALFILERTLYMILWWVYFKLETSIYHYLIFPFCLKLSLMVCGQRYICQRILPRWMSRGICINFYLINWRLSRRRVFIFQLYGYCTVFSAFKVLCERLQILKIKISMFETMVKDYAGFRNIGYLVLDKEKTLYQKIDSKTFISETRNAHFVHKNG